MEWPVSGQWDNEVNDDQATEAHSGDREEDMYS